MRKALWPAAAALALAVSPSAFAADCDGALKNLNQEIAKNERYNVAVRSGMQRDIRRLRDAARILAANGKDDACEDVVAAMKDMLANPKARGGARTAERDVDYKVWIDREKQRLANAAPVTQLKTPINLDSIVGSDVRNPGNEDLGAIDDVIVNPQNGKIEYAIVGHGGFLGIGDKEVAVPWQKLKVTKDNDVFVLNMTEKDMSMAPDYDPEEWAKLDEKQRREKNDKFYEKSAN